MIEEFQIEGYRNLPSTPIRLGKCTVVLGPNNSGKTNFMRALGLWGELYAPGAEVAKVMQAHGGPRLVPRRPQQYIYHASLGLKLRTDDGDTASVHLRYIQERWRVDREEADWEVDGKNAFAVDHSTPAATLGVLDRGEALELPFPNHDTTMGNYGGSFSFLGLLRWSLEVDRYRASDFQNASARQPAPRDVTVRHLDALGKDLANATKAAEQDQDPEVWTRLKARFLAAVGATDLILQEVGGAYLTAAITMPSGRFPLEELSDGTLQLLRMALLTAGPRRGSTLALDEPEIHLHPGWLRTVGNWLMDAPAVPQVVVATHSPELLDALTPGFETGEVVVVVFGRDGTVRQPTAADLRARLDEGWALGDLYRVGDPDLGGWPW